MLSMPPYGSKKIDSLLAKQAKEYFAGKLADSDYNALTLRDKFAYCMIHPESYAQICSSLPAMESDSGRLFAQLPVTPGEFHISERQTLFLEHNKDSVIALMQECINDQGHIGLNFKHAIVTTNAIKLIPLIITTYNFSRSDHDLLTVLMILMKNNSYKKFEATALCSSLYNNASSSYKSYVNFTYKDEALIIKLATSFYYEHNR